MKMTIVSIELTSFLGRRLMYPIVDGKRIKPTGMYTITNGYIRVEFSVPLLIFFHRKVMVHEHSIDFKDIETFQCGQSYEDFYETY